MFKACLFLILLCQISPALFGFGMENCYVVDASKHESNQKLLIAIVKQELASLSPKKTPDEQAKYLGNRINQISDKLLKRGFAAEAYGIPELDENSIVSFNCFSLWEGKSIPLTFFVYVWPSEELALKYNFADPLNRHYCSDIHSHPIPCAFAVLEGTFYQKNYVRSEGGVQFIGEEVFQKCEGSIDDLQEPFIHQMYSKGTGTKPALSLHAYGLSSEAKVMQCFDENSSQHSYGEQ